MVKAMVATAMGKRVGDDGGASEAGFTFEVHAPDFEVPQDVQHYMHEKLAVKLHKVERFVIHVRAYLRDLNGSKGGIDKQCRLEAQLAGLETVTVLENGGDVRAVIDVTIDRFAEAVLKHVERMRTKRVEKGRKMVRNRKLAGNA